MNEHLLLDLATDLGYELAVSGAETYRVEDSARLVLPIEVTFYGTVRTTDSKWGTIGGHIFCYPWHYKDSHPDAVTK